MDKVENDPAVSVDAANPVAGAGETPVASSVPADGSGESTPATPVVVEGGESTEPTAAAVEDGEPEKPVEDWRHKRIAKQAAQLKELREELLKSRQTPDTQPGGTKTEEEIEKLVEAKASQKAAEAQFNSDCNRIAAEGAKLYPDFDSVIKGPDGLATALVDRDDPVSLRNYQQFLAAAIDTGEAPKLLYALGKDLNEATRIANLPPAKMAVELTKLALKPAGGKTLSAAPKPITPVGSRPASHAAIQPDDPEKADRLSTAEWMARRAAQVAERRKMH